MNPLTGSGLSIGPEEIEKGYEKVFTMFKQVYPEIPETLLNEFKAITAIESVKKNTLIIDYGEICRKLYILVEGYVIIYLMIDGIEKPVWFIDVGEMTLAVKSYLDKIPSRERQVAVRDSTFIVLDRDKYQELYDRNPEFEKLEANLFKLYLYESLFRHELSLHEPEARYLLLLKYRPDIIINAKTSELAKYLNISRATLSRKRYAFLKKAIK